MLLDSLREVDGRVGRPHIAFWFLPVLDLIYGAQ